MNKFLIELNKKVWNSLRGATDKYKVGGKEITDTEINQDINTTANNVVGDISSNLSDFYESVSNSTLASKDLKQKAVLKLGQYVKQAKRYVVKTIVAKGNETDMRLLELGYKKYTIKDTQNAIAQTIFAKSFEFEDAINETIVKQETFVNPSNALEQSKSN